MGVGFLSGIDDDSIRDKLLQESGSAAKLDASRWDLDKEENDGDGAHFKLLNIADRYLNLTPQERRHLRDHWFAHDEKDGAYWPRQQVRDKMRRALREAVREARAKNLPIKAVWEKNPSLPDPTFLASVDPNPQPPAVILRITTSPPRQPGP
jgi:hypothetical protein